MEENPGSALTLGVGFLQLAGLAGFRTPSRARSRPACWCWCSRAPPCTATAHTSAPHHTESPTRRPACACARACVLFGTAGGTACRGGGGSPQERRIEAGALQLPRFEYAEHLRKEERRTRTALSDLSLSADRCSAERGRLPRLDLANNVTAERRGATYGMPS